MSSNKFINLSEADFKEFEPQTRYYFDFELKC